MKCRKSYIHKIPNEDFDHLTVRSVSTSKYSAKMRANFKFNVLRKQALEGQIFSTEIYVLSKSRYF